MPSSRILNALPSLTCDQCGDTHLTQSMVVQGEVGFCQRCAYERALGTLGKPTRRSLKKPLLIVAGAALIANLGWWGSNVIPEYWDSFVSNSSIATAPAQAIQSVVSMPPTPIPVE